MKAKHILLGCALAALSANAVAADKTGKGYVGVGYSMMTVSPELLGDYDLSALGVRGGYFFNKYFSVEGRLAFGIGDDSKTYTDGIDFVTLKLELDNSIGVYALGHIPVSDQFELYGLIGFTQVEVTGSASGTLGSGSDSYSDSDLSFGVGAEFNMTPALSLGLEYTSYITDGEIEFLKYDADAINFAVNFYF